MLEIIDKIEARDKSKEFPKMETKNHDIKICRKCKGDVNKLNGSRQETG